LPGRDAQSAALKRPNFGARSQRPRAISRARARSPESATKAFLAAHARLRIGFPLLDAAALARTIARPGQALALLFAVSAKVYRPRFERLEPLFDSIIAGNLAGARTLSGCRIGHAPKARAVFGPATLLIARESPRRSKPLGR
jgi:hypothetical protein